MAAAEVESQGARTVMVGEESTVEGIGVDRTVGGVRGVGEGFFAKSGLGLRQKRRQSWTADAKAAIVDNDSNGRMFSWLGLGLAQWWCAMTILFALKLDEDALLIDKHLESLIPPFPLVSSFSPSVFS